MAEPHRNIATDYIHAASTTFSFPPLTQSALIQASTY